MGKYFPASAQHAKALEFLELKQRTMTMLKYVAKLIELAHFTDDYVATYMAKVRQFEGGLKLSIRGKIVGLLLQDMDSMVRTVMAIKRELDDARSIRDASANVRGGRVNSLPLAQERSRVLLLRDGFRDKVATTRAKGRISHPKIGGTSRLLANQGRECVSSVTSLDTLDGIALRGRDPRVMGHHSSSH